MFTGIFTGGIIELEHRMLYSLAEGQPVLVIPLRRKKKPKAFDIVNKYADTSPADMDKEILTRKKVYKTERNTKRQLVDKYICQYSPYKTQPLGVNVSAVLRLAKEKGCPVSKLSEQDIETLATH